MKRFAAGLLAGAALWAGLPGTLAAEPVDVYGYLVNFVGTAFRGEGPGFDGTDIGYVHYLRIKGDWEPHEALSFHIEAFYNGSLGNRNPWALYDAYGLVDLMAIAADPTADPTADYVQTIGVDHAWARWSGANADFSFGKQPIAWGTGYVFNPSSRASSGAYMDVVRDETPGTFSWLASVSPAWWFTLEGYAAFQDRTASSMVFLQEDSWKCLPFGVRGKFLAGPADLSAGLVRETADYDGLGGIEDRCYVVADGIVGLGPFAVYTETAYLLPAGDAEADWDAWDAFEGLLGLEWLVPGLSVTVRAEYYRQGAGADPSGYDFADLLSGRRMVLGKNYLFGDVEWIFLDYGRLNLSSLVNLDDGSVLLVPQAAWDILADFTVEIGALVFLGENDDEFGGVADLGAGVVDLMENSVFTRLKISF